MKKSSKQRLQWNVRKSHYYFKNAITFLFISLLFIPIGEVFVPIANKTERDSWEYLFVWNDPLNLVLLFFYASLWILYNVKPSKILNIILKVYSIIILSGSLLLATPTQDLILLWGIPIQLLLVLVMLFYLVKIDNLQSRID